MESMQHCCLTLGTTCNRKLNAAEAAATSVELRINQGKTKVTKVKTDSFVLMK